MPSGQYLRTAANLRRKQCIRCDYYRNFLIKGRSNWKICLKSKLEIDFPTGFNVCPFYEPKREEKKQQ